MTALASMSRRSAIRLAFVTPLILFMLIAVAFPLGYGLWIAFTERTVASSDGNFVGLRNFIAVLSDPQFLNAIRFTVMFTAGAVAMEMILGTALALALDRLRKVNPALMAFVLMPIMIPASLLGVLWRLALNPDVGVVPAVGELLGSALNPLAPSTVIATVMIVDALHWTPFVTLLVYGALQGVDSEIYEAASVDGATSWRTIWTISVPLVRPTLFVVLVLRLIDTIKTFDIIYVLTGGGPGNLTRNVNIYIYEQAFRNGNFGAAAAASVVLLAILMIGVPFATKKLLGR